MCRLKLIPFVLAIASIGCSNSVQNSIATKAQTITEQNTVGAKHIAPHEGIVDAGKNDDVAQSQAASNEVADQTKELSEIFECLFRYQFQKNASGAQQNAKAYFLSIKREDPTPEFLERFSRHTTPVKNGSEFATGEGISFRIDEWKWISDSRVEIIGGYYEGELSSSGNRYILVRKEGKWFVESDRMQWIS